MVEEAVDEIVGTYGGIVLGKSHVLGKIRFVVEYTEIVVCENDSVFGVEDVLVFRHSCLRRRNQMPVCVCNPEEMEAVRSQGIDKFFHPASQVHERESFYALLGPPCPSSDDYPPIVS